VGSGEVGTLGWVAGVVEADLAGRADRPLGLAWLLTEEPVVFGGPVQAALDHGRVEGGAGAGC
jgi:hypothetical protein